MPANSTHLDYDANLAAWLRARDVIAGEDAIKSGGAKYLPRLDSQTDDEYDAYKTRACFFNATSRTRDGFVGLLFRRDPEVKLPDAKSGVGASMSGFALDVDLMGTSLFSYCKAVVGEVLAVGRAGTLVDWNDGGDGGQVGQDENRAYLVRYAAEDILNWQTQRINGRNVLSLVALREFRDEPSADDPFRMESIETVRVLRLDVARDGTTQYVVEIWQHQKRASQGQVVRSFWNGILGSTLRAFTGSTQWKLVETRVPLRLGKPLPLIPFVFHGPQNSLTEVAKLPMGDIIFVNLDHYRLDADYKHGMHYTALPTAWVSGFDKDADLRIGSSTAWVAQAPGAVAGFLEFTGHGLSTFENAQNHDERQMATLGSRMLEDTKRVGETADAIELRQAGENSILMTLALSVSDSVSQVLRWVYWWHSTEASPKDITDETVVLRINTDFTAKGLSSVELTAIVGAWQAGAISQATMFDLFRKGEVLPTGRTDAEEKTLIGALRTATIDQNGRANGPGVFPNGGTTPVNGGAQGASEPQLGRPGGASLPQS